MGNCAFLKTCGAKSQIKGSIEEQNVGVSTAEVVANFGEQSATDFNFLFWKFRPFLNYPVSSKIKGSIERTYTMIFLCIVATPIFL